MTTRPSAELRRHVIERAGSLCEYCLFPQDFAASVHQVDHVIAEKHGGITSLDNLALSCSTCNRRKASDIACLDPFNGELAPLFNPRTQRWSDHFALDGLRITGRTPEGRATVDFLKLNSPERLAERSELARAGRFPPRRAR